MDDLDGRRHAAALGAKRPGAVLCGARWRAHGRACRPSRRHVEWCGQPSEGPRGALRHRKPVEKRNYDVSADGQRFLMVKQPANQAAAPQIVVVQNWFEELKRLVPVK